MLRESGKFYMISINRKKPEMKKNPAAIRDKLIATISSKLLRSYESTKRVDLIPLAEEQEVSKTSRRAISNVVEQHIDRKRAARSVLTAHSYKIKSLTSKMPVKASKFELRCLKNKKYPAKLNKLVGFSRDVSYMLDSLANTSRPVQDCPLVSSIEELKRIGKDLNPARDFSTILAQDVGSVNLLLKQDIFKSIPPAFYGETQQAFFGQMPNHHKKEESRDLGVPSSRTDSVVLLEWLDEILGKIKREADDKCFELTQTAYYVCFREVIRQISVQCVERGALVWRLWNAYLSLVNELAESCKREHRKLLLEESAKASIIHKVYKAEIESLNEKVLEAYRVKEEGEAETKKIRKEMEGLSEELSEIKRNEEEKERERGSVLEENRKLKREAKVLGDRISVLQKERDIINNKGRIYEELFNRVQRERDKKGLNLAENASSFNADNEKSANSLDYSKECSIQTDCVKCEAANMYDIDIAAKEKQKLSTESFETITCEFAIDKVQAGNEYHDRLNIKEMSLDVKKQKSRNVVGSASLNSTARRMKE